MGDIIPSGSGGNSLLDQFRSRYNRAQGVADLWMALHQACYFFAIPNRNKFWRPAEQQGEMRGARVFDTTAIESTKTFVSKLQTTMTPPQQQWGYFTLTDDWKADNEEDVDEAQMILDEYMRRLFSFIHSSNFDVVINECYFDLAVGTSCLVINQYTDNKPLLFTSVPMDKLAIEEAMTGRIESWYRNWENVKINEITKRWPKAIISSAMKQMLTGDANATVRMLYEGVMYVPTEKRPYCYIVCSDMDIIYHEYFEINPGIVWRFQKTNNDVFGRGPVMDALPSIISLNEMAKIELASANLNVFKPYMGFSDAVFNPHTFKMQPMTVIPIAPIGTSGQVPLIPLPDTSNPQFAQLTIQDLRMQIKSLLFSDSPIPQDSKQPASATELMIMKQQMAEKIGPLFSRLQQEFLEPVIERCAYILNSMGHLPYPKIDKKHLVFKYKSPLALSHGMEKVSQFTQYYQLLQGMLGAENAQIYINSAQVPWKIASLMQIEESWLNTPKAVAQVAQSMQNQMNEQQEIAQQQGEEQAVPNQNQTVMNPG